MIESLKLENKIQKETIQGLKEKLKQNDKQEQLLKEELDLRLKKEKQELQDFFEVSLKKKQKMTE